MQLKSAAYRQVTPEDMNLLEEIKNTEGFCEATQAFSAKMKAEGMFNEDELLIAEVCFENGFIAGVFSLLMSQETDHATDD